MALRLFIGVALDDATRAALERALRKGASVAPSALRLLAADNWHFTLQFLGSVAESDLAAVQRACAAAAAACAPFEIELGAAGAFKSAHSARVLWIGLARGAEGVTRLYEALLVHTEPLGFEREKRAFSAHLTIARARDPFDARPWLAALRIPPQRMQVSTLTLFRLAPFAEGRALRGARAVPAERLQLTPTPTPTPNSDSEFRLGHGHGFGHGLSARDWRSRPLLRRRRRRAGDVRHEFSSGRPTGAAELLGGEPPPKLDPPPPPPPLPSWQPAAATPSSTHSTRVYPLIRRPRTGRLRPCRRRRTS